jgi:hypothetical protein
MDKQSVHMRSVQESLTDAIAHVMSASPHSPWNRKYLDILFKKTKASTMVQKKIRYSAADSNPHSGLGVTFGALLERLVAMIESMDTTRQDSIYSIISNEFEMISKVCLTGQFTHILSCLNGIVDGFYVGINSSEALGNTLARIRNKWAEKCGNDINVYVENAIPEALQALEDACISQEEQKYWISGI